MKSKRLGRGLDALIPQVSEQERTEKGDSLFEVDVRKVRTNPSQPRAEFNREKLEELKISIAENGVIQPITVREVDDGYEIIAGERRFRAVTELGFAKVPAFVMDVSTEEQMLELALVENIQREDLNPIDVAKGYQQLQKEYGLTQEQVAQKVGKDRATVANFIRLLKLAPKIQESLQQGEISMGHARTLMGLSSNADQIQTWKKCVKQGWSVRKLEKVVRDAVEGPSRKKLKKVDTMSQAYTELEDKLRSVLGTQVKIRSASKGGKIEVSYYSEDELERLIDLMLGS